MACFRNSNCRSLATRNMQIDSPSNIFIINNDWWSTWRSTHTEQILSHDRTQKNNDGRNKVVCFFLSVGWFPCSGIRIVICVFLFRVVCAFVSLHFSLFGWFLFVTWNAFVFATITPTFRCFYDSNNVSNVTRMNNLKKKPKSFVLGRNETKRAAKKTSCKQIR